MAFNNMFFFFVFLAHAVQAYDDGHCAMDASGKNCGAAGTTLLQKSGDTTGKTVLLKSHGRADPEPYENRFCNESFGSDAIGRDYRGCMTYSRGGCKCRPWTATDWHPHQGLEGPGGEEGNALCRNPDNDPSGLWCNCVPSENGPTYDYCGAQEGDTKYKDLSFADCEKKKDDKKKCESCCIEKCETVKKVDEYGRPVEDGAFLECKHFCTSVSATCGLKKKDFSDCEKKSEKYDAGDDANKVEGYDTCCYKKCGDIDCRNACVASVEIPRHYAAAQKARAEQIGEYSSEGGETGSGS